MKEKPELVLGGIGLLMSLMVAIGVSTGEHSLADSSSPVAMAEGRLHLPLVYDLATPTPSPEPTIPPLPTVSPQPTVPSPAMGTTERVSVDSTGAQANAQSYAPSLSSDGGWVAFVSEATNLVPDDTNGQSDIFCHQRATGQTVRVSVASSGAQADGPSGNSTISADGRVVAYESAASNLVAGDTNDAWDIYVWERAPGSSTGHTRRVSVGFLGQEAAWGAGRPALSADGRIVAFDSLSPDLVADDLNDVDDVYVHDLETRRTTRVSVSSLGEQANGPSVQAALSADGRVVVFQSSASNLVPEDTNETSDIFCRERGPEPGTGETTRVSVDSPGGQANGGSYAPSVSADGRFVVFTSVADNLVPNDTNGVADIFVHDRVTGRTMRVSVDSSGNQADGSSNRPVISGDGRSVAFWSEAGNLVTGDNNGVADVFCHDLGSGRTTRASLASWGAQAKGGSYWPALSGDGRSVAFWSAADNLVPGDTNGVKDVFYHERWPAGE